MPRRFDVQGCVRTLVGCNRLLCSSMTTNTQQQERPSSLRTRRSTELFEARKYVEGVIHLGRGAVNGKSPGGTPKQRSLLHDLIQKFKASLGKGARSKRIWGQCIRNVTSRHMGKSGKLIGSRIGLGEAAAIRHISARSWSRFANRRRGRCLSGSGQTPIEPRAQPHAHVVHTSVYIYACG